MHVKGIRLNKGETINWRTDIIGCYSAIAWKISTEVWNGQEVTITKVNGETEDGSFNHVMSVVIA